MALHYFYLKYTNDPADLQTVKGELIGYTLLIAEVSSDLLHLIRDFYCVSKISKLASKSTFFLS